MELRIRILKYSGDIVQTGYIASIAVSATLNGVAPFTKHPTTYHMDNMDHYGCLEQKRH